MRKLESVVCDRCGKVFVKASGGFVPESYMGESICPACNKEDLKSIWDKIISK